MFWKDVKVGNIVKILCDQGFPADMILINSSEVNGLCYVETKNLDGETNLKYKQANARIADLIQNERDMYAMRGEVECKKPDEFIFQFDGKIRIGNEIIPIDKSSFLLRGCNLKQTEFVYGLVVYVGHNTKIMKNSPSAKHKVSNIEKTMNYQIIIIFFLQIFLSTIAAIMNIIWVNNNIV
jgi:phospholipid-transporting ATPase